MSAVFVNFGFGPIGAGLFVFEAHAARAFDRIVVAEVAAGTVAAARAAGGYFSVNIAGRDGLSAARVGPVALRNPGVPADAAALLDDMAEACEMATALPSVEFFERGSPCVADFFAEAADRKARRPDLPPAIVYCGENHNHAAELLAAAVQRRRRAPGDGRIEYLNTVIGKMSGHVSDPEELRARDLVPIVPGLERAFLVEEFNAILVSRPARSDLRRRIRVFQEKADLLPFEEAKLYGHNAVHALLGYLGAERGYAYIAQACGDAEIGPLAFAALVEESGAALGRKYAGLDALFSLGGWRAYADDLWSRMANPFLRDSVARVIRDPKRKLGWNDRIVGTLRLALAHDVLPARYARGGAAALRYLGARDRRGARRALEEIWAADRPAPEEQKTVLDWLLAAFDSIEAATVP